MSDWIEYTGSDAQIEEIRNAEHGFIYQSKFIQCRCSDIKEFAVYMSAEMLKQYMSNTGATHYLICNHHPLADMIKIWADTGQPVYWKSKTGGGTGCCTQPFAYPDDFEYSFTPFEDVI